MQTRLVTSERGASVFQRRAEALLHSCHPARRQGQVLPHFHVHLPGTIRRLSHQINVDSRSVNVSVPCLQPNASTDTLQSITSGDWDVTQVLAYNEDSQLM